MPRAARRRSPNTPWLVAVLVLLVVAAGLAAYFFWPGGGSSPGDEAARSTTTTPPASSPAPSSTTTSAAPTTAPPSTSTTTEPPPTPPLAFDTGKAMQHIKVLAGDIGVRRSGTDGEDEAVAYVAGYLEELGYAVQVTEVPLPNGLESHNVRAAKHGTSPFLIVLGAHVDTKRSSPGANDNASGVAVVLELARDLRDADVTAGFEFVLFGAEEIIDSNRDHHHYGSRRFVEEMTEDERAVLVGMISVDMVAYGGEPLVRTMDRGPQLLSEMLLDYTDQAGMPWAYRKDGGSSGQSDHEPFELAGYPAAWLEWQEDPTYHTAGDTYEHCDPGVVERTGRMLLSFLSELTEAELQALADARELD